MLQAHGPTGNSRHETSTRRTRFLQACVDADLPRRPGSRTRSRDGGPTSKVPQSRQHQRPDRGLPPRHQQIKRVTCGP